MIVVVNSPSEAAVRVRTVVAQALGGELTSEDALRQVEPEDVEGLLHASLAAGAEDVELTRGMGASPGAAVGRVCLTAEVALDTSDRGEPVILVRLETSPDDVAGMSVAKGVLTARGGLVSHAALVARGWGLPCVVGADEIRIGDDHFSVGEMVVAEGDTISIDGSTGSVTLGGARIIEVEVPSELWQLLEWADEVAADTLGVRANADTAGAARIARKAGAVGIGLCRTEHMFLAPDRLPVVRAMILAETEAAEAEALEQLAEAQREDFIGILEAMDGLPVTVRLLDPPLHEFLPDVEDLVVAEALGELDDEGHRLLKAARHWAEANPMIGTRGVRLAHVRPNLYRVQARALFEAVIERRKAGGNPQVEIMIPLTVSGPEFAEARRWVEEVAVEVALGEKPVVGTMIETPRAALVAGSLAAHADFFSIGSNDLTQLTFGFSRDDVAGRFLGHYLELGLLDHDPFDRLDDAAVGELIDLAVKRGRVAAPGLKVGVCGEHAGHPASIRRLLAAGVDYLSCSPARLPVARLAAARAVLGA
jgi:pyruvate,orthophosphate dikinase